MIPSTTHPVHVDLFLLTLATLLLMTTATDDDDAATLLVFAASSCWVRTEHETEDHDADRRDQ